ncbi:MAG: YceI family protein [Flavobacteriales bacterium]|nr:YceI family protein [Flavobacteriales bacterium]
MKKASALIFILILGTGLCFGQVKEYDCLVLQVISEVTVQGSANIGGFKCYTSPLTPEDPLPSCFEKAPGYIRITEVQFDIPVDDFDCGNPLILRDLKDVLECDEHPFIAFNLNHLMARDVNGLFYQGEVEATTTVRGQQKDILIPIEVDVLGPQEYKVAGRTTIKLSWYGIAQPSRMFGLLTLNDEVDVCFDLYFTKSNGIAPTP